MLAVYKKDKTNPDVQWAKLRQSPILENSAFITKVKQFENDEGLSIGKRDLKLLLESAKEYKAQANSNSTIVVITPTKGSYK